MPDVEWRITDRTEPETVVNAAQRKPPRWRGIVLLLVIVIGIGVGLAYRSLPEVVPHPTSTPLPPTTTPKALPARLYEAIDREARALADGDAAIFLDLQVYKSVLANQARDTFQAWGRPTDDHPLYSVINFGLRTPDHAWADIRQFRNGHSFRETRFYVWDNDRWLRDDPDPFFWKGEVGMLDTPHLHVIYAVEDHELAQVVADQMEGLYTSLCANLNCAGVTLPLTYTMKMNHFQQVGNNFSGNFGEDGRTLSLLSPRMTGVYEGTRPPYLQSDLLPYLMGWSTAQRIAYGRAVDLAYGSSTAPGGMTLMVTIANWAVSRVNKWDAARKLQADSFKSGLQSPLPLENLWKPAADDTMQRSYEEAFAVVYFIEQQYGEAAVPNVLKNLGQVQSFADLIEKSLGVPFKEFDQQWQAWLKQ